MAPNRLGSLLLLALALTACSKKPAAEPAAPDLAALRAQRDSARKVAEAESAARLKFSTCADSVSAVMKKTADGRKKLAVQPPEGMIRPEFLQACGKPPATTLASGPAPAPANPTPSPAPVASTPPAGPAMDTGKTALTDKQKQVLRSDSIRKARQQAKDDSAKHTAVLARGDSMKKAQSDSTRGDSLKTAKETEVLRETFSYAGGSRDPFVSLISTAKVGPEFSDLQLVGIYQDLRYASNSVAVVRDRNSQKRYKLRVGDQVGRLKVAQIRQLDVVFTVEDFGFERQETLSMRKREADTP